jgi:ElaB/YqjD/DUF883 family membrane-anchored ribosome-binding protein
MSNTEKATDFAHETIDKIVHATRQTTDTLEEKGEQIINAEKQLIKDCHSFIRDKPIASLGIAVVSGFVLSRLLSGR